MLSLEFVHFCFLMYTWSCKRSNDPLTEVDNKLIKYINKLSHYIATGLCAGPLRVQL